MLNKKMTLCRNRVAALVFSVLFVEAIQYAPGAWAESHKAGIDGHADCSDGRQSGACGWSGTPDLKTIDGGSKDGGRGRTGSKALPPLTQVPAPEKKTADIAKCEERKTTDTDDAAIMYKASMRVCAAKHSSWLGHMIEGCLKDVLPMFGYPSLDCETVTAKAYSDKQNIVNSRFNACMRMQ